MAKFGIPVPDFAKIVGYEKPDERSPYGYEVLADGRRLPLAPRRAESLKREGVLIPQNEVDRLILEAAALARGLLRSKSSGAAERRLAAVLYCYALGTVSGVRFEDVVGILARARKAAGHVKDKSPHRARRRDRGEGVEVPGAPVDTV